MLAQIHWNLGHWSVVCNQTTATVVKEIRANDYTNAIITPLHLAAKYGLSKQLEVLLSEGFDIEGPCLVSMFSAEQMLQWLRPLHFSILYNHPTTTRILLAHKAQTESLLYVNSLSWTPLACAVIKNQGEIIKLLLDSKANPFCNLGTKSLSAFELALTKGDKETLGLIFNFLSNSANNWNVNLGQVLKLCIDYRYYDSITLLLNQGADCEQAILSLVESGNLIPEKEQILRLLLTQSKNKIDTEKLAKKAFGIDHSIVSLILGLCLLQIPYIQNMLFRFADSLPESSRLKGAANLAMPFVRNNFQLAMGVATLCSLTLIVLSYMTQLQKRATTKTLLDRLGNDVQDRLQNSALREGKRVIAPTIQSAMSSHALPISKVGLFKPVRLPPHQKVVLHESVAQSKRK